MQILHYLPAAERPDSSYKDASFPPHLQVVTRLLTPFCNTQFLIVNLFSSLSIITVIKRLEVNQLPKHFPSLLYTALSTSGGIWTASF